MKFFEIIALVVTLLAILTSTTFEKKIKIKKEKCKGGKCPCNDHANDTPSTSYLRSIGYLVN